jgi:hypothetical protein
LYGFEYRPGVAVSFRFGSGIEIAFVDFGLPLCENPRKRPLLLGQSRFAANANRPWLPAISEPSQNGSFSTS